MGGEINHIVLGFGDTPPKLIFDLGANVGKYSIDFASAFPESQIYAFEPVEQTFKQLQENIASENLENRIHAKNFGLAAKDETANIGRPQHRPDKLTNSGLFSRYYSFETDFDVRPCTFKNLNTFCKEYNLYPDFIKLDIEGSELEVLQSIEGDVLQKVRGILIEVSDEPRFPNNELINNLLISNNFDAKFPDLNFIPPLSTRKHRWCHTSRKAYNRFWMKNQPQSIWVGFG